MKNLKRLGTAIALTCVLGAVAFAGETSAPPCAPPAPGETSAPPCSGGQIAPDPAAPGEVNTPPATAAADATTFAIDLLESMLTLF